MNFCPVGKTDKKQALKIKRHYAEGLQRIIKQKNQKNNTNLITKSIVNTCGSISAGTVAQFVRNNHVF
jgi:hypothetical protein